MIADLDETLRRLLIEELPVKNGEIEIQFDQPNREWSAKLSKPTINLFLYDLRENNQLREHRWTRVREENGTVTQKRTPMRVNCHYMLTTWGSDPGDEHRLMTRAMIALFRFPTLPEDRLVGTLRNPPYELLAQLAQHDKLTNPAEIWSALDNEIRPSVSYIVTLALDPWMEVTGPAVKSFELNTGQARDLPRFDRLDPENTRNKLSFLGGTVRAGKGGGPIEGITVALKGTGFLATTGPDGRFRLHGFPPGDHTLIVWPPEGKPKERKIRMPLSKETDLDFEV
jgi:hypothetical protein